MSLKPLDIPNITEITLPEVWNVFQPAASYTCCHLAHPKENLTCTATVVQGTRNAVSRLSILPSSGDKIAINKQSENDLFEQATRILNDNRAVVVGNRLIPSKKATWQKHPSLIQADIVEISRMARESWKTGLSYKEEIRDEDSQIVTKGLRPPQIGALHAIAAHWTVSKKAALVVMPTGTGKTEVMLACMVMKQPRRLLVLVPSDALREQTFGKFLSLGVLRTVGAVANEVMSPVTTIITATIKSVDEVKPLEDCNVVISTVAAVQGMSPIVLKAFSKVFDTVFFDEAHHVRAASWERMFEAFEKQAILQFTATPFRLDGKRMPGRIIYNFPLRLAQAQGYFRKINFLEVYESDADEADIKIADSAVQQLRKDRAEGKKHLLLARCDTTARADAIAEIYATRHGDLNPIAIHSKTPQRRQKLEDIREGKHQIIVCVDMFGEGFDLPALKIAALHDPHQSLAITLQFTGRFTRDAEGIGNASLVANIADPKVTDAIEELYAEDSDWNALIPELSAKAIQSQLDFSDFLDRMENSEKGDEELFDLNILKPKTSTVIYKAGTFAPRNFRTAIKKSSHLERVWHSKDKDLLVFITRTKVPIEWATIKETSNESWDLFIVAYDVERKLLFINSSQKGTLHPELAKAIGGKDASLLNGENMFRSLSNIHRLIFHNVGLYSRGTKLRFRMYTGLDIGEAITPAVQVGSMKSNLFAVGYENGQKVSVGASHKGRLWSMSSCSIPDWREWCGGIATKILDESIPTNDFMKHTLIPKEIDAIPSGKDFFCATFPIVMYSSDMQSVRFYAGGLEFDYHTFGIETFTKKSDTHIELMFAYGDEKSASFELTWGPKMGGFSVKQTTGDTLEIYLSSVKQRFDEFLVLKPPAFIAVDGTEMAGARLLEPPNSLPFTFDPATIVEFDWENVDITKESKWRRGVERANSIQGEWINHLKQGNSDIVFDDDDKGEVADIVEITETNEEVHFHFYHCKYSDGHEPGQRAGDCYIVCGQAVRSIRWTVDPLFLINHLQARENSKHRGGRPTRFEKGNARTLMNLKRRLRKLRVRYSVSIVQPGISKNAFSPQLSSVLGSANSFLAEITGTSLGVIASK